MTEIRKENIQFQWPASISVTDTNSPETFPPHWHSAAEFTLALKSGCKYRVNDTLYELNAGDVLLVWPRQVHETIEVPEGAVVFVQFSSAIIESNLDLVSISRFLHECNRIESKKYPDLCAYLAENILNIQKFYRSSDPLTETRCKQCVYNSLLKIGEHVLGENKNLYTSDDESGAGWKYIHAACNFIMEKSSENLTQAIVADHVGLSTFYFSKLFKKYMHISFPAYLSNIRVKSATSLLLNKDLSITECAFMAGFQSTTAFNRAFHDITGYSPREYRKLYK
ncbi:MAG: AraC family transcriptional regulator [Lachnospiraceae bacterium]|nr:AraC family transcriptional regulator [Lachnospiraceae bacterium]